MANTRYNANLVLISDARELLQKGYVFFYNKEANKITIDGRPAWRAFWALKDRGEIEFLEMASTSPKIETWWLKDK